ncbi:MAG TPA: TadE/TadG family type IV pilus assembly protein [Pirellulales bacterium]|nr:TadE/TadG family type IV pilus assembly protein [Pirellulales bacterium]
MIARRFIRANLRYRRGAAAVEFALVAPVFFILLFGLIEYGRAVMVQQILTNAAREGGRVAILTTATSTSVKSAVTTYLTNAGISGATPTVSPDPATATSGQTITVQVTVPFTSVSWLPTPQWLGSKTLKAVSAMRTESTASSSGS